MTAWNTDLSFKDRLELAYADARTVFERRGSFISDDDVTDVAERWTTDDIDWSDLDASRPDFEALRDTLTVAIFEQS